MKFVVNFFQALFSVTMGDVKAVVQTVVSVAIVAVAYTVGATITAIALAVFLVVAAVATAGFIAWAATKAQIAMGI